MATRAVYTGIGRQAGSAPFQLKQLWRKAGRMLEVRRTRQSLANLDVRLLADVGIGPGDAQMEVSRPFWDVATRRR